MWAPPLDQQSCECEGVLYIEAHRTPCDWPKGPKWLTGSEGSGGPGRYLSLVVSAHASPLPFYFREIFLIAQVGLKLLFLLPPPKKYRADTCHHQAWLLLS